jgi:hypothetical protein
MRAEARNISAGAAKSFEQPLRQAPPWMKTKTATSRQPEPR